jgi:hypothetical protein
MSNSQLDTLSELPFSSGTRRHNCQCCQQSGDDWSRWYCEAVSVTLSRVSIASAREVAT